MYAPSKFHSLPNVLGFQETKLTMRQSRVDEDEIEMQTEALRKKLTAGSAEGGKNAGRSQLKPHQVHELAAAKIEESEKLRKALGIREDYEEGSHWKKQEERMRDATEERIKEER